MCTYPHPPTGQPPKAHQRSWLRHTGNCSSATPDNCTSGIDIAHVCTPPLHHTSTPNHLMASCSDSSMGIHPPVHAQLAPPPFLLKGGEVLPKKTEKKLPPGPVACMSCAGCAIVTNTFGGGGGGSTSPECTLLSESGIMATHNGLSGSGLLLIPLQPRSLLRPLS